MAEAPSTIRIYGARWKSALRSIGSIAVAAVLIALAITTQGTARYPVELSRPMLGLAAATAAFLAAFSAYRAFKPASVELTSEGFRVHGVRRPLFIKWEDVEEFSLYRLNSQSWAAFVLKQGVQTRDQGLTRRLTPGVDGLIAVFPGDGPQSLVELLSDWQRKHLASRLSA